ncbi:MAG: hypothetical protein A2Y58_03175 [Chloroflexi bacterium RBG_13_51_52]|nr:MAG: hypothetical protein A2Y58_03175 [Chloroflexi bacterium RBG_13_51_52]
MDTNNNTTGQKLVQDEPLGTNDLPALVAACNKKRIRRIAEPHIESYTSNGQQYYRYRRGSDQPIYLGTAESILAAIMEIMEKKNVKR